jgi:cytochrome b561
VPAKGVERETMMRADSHAELRVFDRATRLIHWLTAALMLLVFVLAFSIDIAASRTSHIAFLQLHRSVGLTIWVLSLGRFVWRCFAKYPNWPSDMSRSMQIAAMASEYALYALLLTQPLLGLLQTNAHGDQVNLFFIGQLPALIEKNRQLAQTLLGLHKAVGFSLLGLIAVHAAAALFHHFWRRDDTLTAMLPAAHRRQINPPADQNFELEATESRAES